MVPITRDSTYPYTDPVSGTVYHLRYITGDYQDRFDAILSEARSRGRNAVVAATRMVDAMKPSDKPKPGTARQEMIRRIATEEAMKTDTEAANFAYARKIVDLFVVGWTGKGVAGLPDGQPASSMLKYGAVIELSEIITKLGPELTGLGDDLPK
jgi:hypothetical protein